RSRSCSREKKEDIKAFEKQGPRAIEAGALGARFLCLYQWRQFGAEIVPAESHSL
ncbi:KIAA0556 isoform 4, partial [Pongo abelii]